MATETKKTESKAGSLISKIGDIIAIVSAVIVGYQAFQAAYDSSKAGAVAPKGVEE